MTSEPPRSPAPAPGPTATLRRLRGRVLRADGAPGAGATVAVSTQRLRTSEPLCATSTDIDGCYLVEFTRPTGPADLLVEVSLDGTSARAVRALDGRPDTPLDLTLPADRRSDYERLLADLTPLLDGADPAQLTPEEIDFLARATGQERNRVARLAAAARHAVATGQPAEVFHALLRYGHPDDLGHLAQLRAADVRRALTPPPAGHPTGQPRPAGHHPGRAPATTNHPADAHRGAGDGVDGAPAAGGRPTGERAEGHGAAGQHAEGHPARAGDGSAGPGGVHRAGQQQDLSAHTDAFLTALRTRQLAAAAAPAAGLAAGPAAATPLARLFALAVSDPSARERLYGAYLDRTDGADDTWHTEAAAGPDTARHTDRLRLVLGLAATTATATASAGAGVRAGASATAEHPDLVAVVLDRFDSGELAELRDLVTLDEQWSDLVALAGGPPPGREAAEYAESVRAAVAAAHPTAYVAHKLAALPEHRDAPAARFLAANPDFDLAGTPVNCVTVPDADARRELAPVQRVFKISPHFETMQALRADGFESAQAVARIDRAGFARRMAGHVDETEAYALHERATRIHATAVNLVADLRTAGHFDVPWLPARAAADPRIPDWEKLFGSADYPSVEDWQTFYGQPAYLVDLLYYLRRLGENYGTPPPTTSGDGPVADVLFARRPDLWELRLGKDNTELVLPYVDLVNELLESAVAPGTAVPAERRQTTGDAAELRVRPQHVNPGAYEKLRTAVYPWDQPFDLWHAQTGACLTHLGVTRDALLTTLGVSGASPDEAGATRTAERLGLSRAQHRIIAGEPLTPARTLAEFYGRPADRTPADLVTDMTPVRALLDTGHLRYAELDLALRTRFVNPGGAVTIQSDPVHPYDTNSMTLTGVDAAFLDRFHRFVRLRRALGLSDEETDRLIAGSGSGGRLDPAALRCIAAARALAARLSLDADQVLAFSQPLDTHPHPGAARPPLYDRLFLDPAVVTVPPGQAHPFRLTPDRTELQEVGPLTGRPAITAALLAVLRVNDEELAALTTGPDAVIGDRLDLLALTKLVAWVTLARAAALGVPDTLRLARYCRPFLWITTPTTAGDRSAYGETELAGGAPVRLPARPAYTPGESELGGGAPLAFDDRDQVAAAAPAQPIDPGIARTEEFLDLAELLAEAGLTVADLDAVLLAAPPGPGGQSPVPRDEALAATLTTLRAAVQTIHQQTARTTDDKGELTRKNLALLGWDTALVQQAVATLLGTVTYTAPLPALPAGLVLPPDLPLRHEPAEPPADGRLTFGGPMTGAQRDRILALSADEPFRTAVNALHDGPRAFVRDRMKLLRIPVFAASLAALPAGYGIPPTLTAKVFHDPSLRALRCRGYLTGPEHALLTRDGTPAEILRAVGDLMTAQQAPPADGNGFLDAQHAGALFDSADVTPADRFHLVLERLAPYLRRTLSETAVVQQLGQATGLDTASADPLLRTWLRPAGRPPVLQDFLEPEFTNSDPGVSVTRTAFDRQFRTLAFLYRVTLLLGRLRVTAEEIPYVFGYAAQGGWLNPNTLPLTPVQAAPIAPLRTLLDLGRLRSAIRGGVPTLRAVFDVARTPGAQDREAAAELARRTGWSAADITVVARDHGIATAAQYGGVAVLRSVQAGIALLRRLGVAAERAQPWQRPELTADAAETAWLTAKSRHSPRDWTAAATPLRDALRERQRAALVSYLVANPLRNDAGTPLWQDANGLHDHFLLDVEMGPTQLTARIAQAIYTVQLFVQRIQLNLEHVYTWHGDGLWGQWEWMKQYRLWEANQKVFLYPENYFEPELRRNKTPFFTDFENALMQREVTSASVEDAVKGYLESLDKVARLRPAGLCHENTASVGDLHLIGRSEATPREHYYRKRVDGRYWTPWERIELDVDGDPVVPALWNGRPFLFWSTHEVVSEQQQLKMPPPNEALADPPQHLEFKLNWSQYVAGKWQHKTVAKEIQYARPGGATYDAEHVLQPERYVIATRQNDYDPEEFEVEYLFGLPSESGLRYHLSGGYYLTPRLNAATFGVFIKIGGGYGPLPTLPHTEPYYGEFVRIRGGFAPYFMFDVQNPWYKPALELFRNSPGFGLPRLLCSHTPTDRVATRFYQTFTDEKRAFLLVPQDYGTSHVQILPLYHPYTQVFSARLAQDGMDGLYDRDVQLRPESFGVPFDFTRLYAPNMDVVHGELPTETLDFVRGGPYSDYNWELFFHAPLLGANRLSTNQRFAEAQKWLHRVFDPTDRADLPEPQRYWRTQPFYRTEDYAKEQIEVILRRLAEGGWHDTEEVYSWLTHPFEPDVVARLRTTAYQKAVVMKYLDNLIAWGDRLFRQDTMESVNQATQLYILASQLLGRRPDEVTGRAVPEPKNYRQVVQGARGLTSAVIRAEHLVPTGSTPAGTVSATARIAPGFGLNWLDSFVVPRNDKLLGYWDTVADRLSKIRAGQNISGVQRRAALFGTAIDPALLVRAAAAGLSIESVLDDISAPVPPYRFATMAAKAKELTNEVKAFGAALLAALEKRDAEALARLRSRHEISVLKAARAVREQQVSEADASLQAAQKQRAAADGKVGYYSSRAYMNIGEIAHTVLSAAAIVHQAVAAGVDMTASAMGLIPDVKTGTPTTMGLTFGGQNLSQALHGLSGSLDKVATTLNGAGALAATMAGYDRRQDDWDFQAEQGRVEQQQIDRQIIAAEIRLKVAQKELENHDLQLSNAREADAFLYDKYTSEELYDWMAGRLATGYFQAYQLAHDLAKRAERAFRHELGVEDSDHIRFGYWDSLYKGLLAGEQLSVDLGRLDAAYHEANAREFELTKRISLAQIDPVALLRLKETGSAYLSLPEALFDLDTPGHYLRRIKSLALTVPCVAGPYTSVNLTATLLDSTVRVDPRLSDGKYARQRSDTRFRDSTGAGQSIVTSTGQDDTGLFETSLRDERFLPFEGAGAVSQWRLSLPEEFRQFDYESISDVVLHLRYTARDGGSALAERAVAELRTALTEWARGDGASSLYRVFSARREFGDRWSRFLTPQPGQPATLRFTVAKDRFPYAFRDERITVSQPELLLVLSGELRADGRKRYVDCYGDGEPLAGTLTARRGHSAEVRLSADPSLGGQPRGAVDGAGGAVTEVGEEWELTVPAEHIAALAADLREGSGFAPEAVVDLLLVVRYTVAKVER
ncbi:neuraminidase-like domain-containing protein [Streptomyces sp. NPDC002122]|uniref:Tc toxin subunit A-related protein n=1 Tax=Streptomyces sp. NPDC002122 TaxID=3154407 RepID=UPI003328DB8D